MKYLQNKKHDGGMPDISAIRKNRAAVPKAQSKGLGCSPTSDQRRVSGAELHFTCKMPRLPVLNDGIYKMFKKRDVEKYKIKDKI